MIVKGGASAYPGGGTRAAQCGASVSIMEFARAHDMAELQVNSLRCDAIVGRMVWSY